MQVAAHTRPDQVHWCDGSEAEYRELVRLMIAAGDLIKLNEKTFPGCHLHRSNPSDVARVEHLTFVCTENKEDAGPNNHWMAPAAARSKMDALFAGSMRGRTMYVIPYCMGPIDSPYSRCGVEITDSAYVAANMKLMTRMGAAALARIARDGTFVKGLHSIGELDPGAPLHHALPGVAGNPELRLGLWRQCAARKEMPCASHRELAGAHGGLARRAHADRRRRESRGRNALPRLRLPIRLRQDESRDADPAALDAWLEDLDGR